METEIKFCPRCGAEIAPLTSGYVCPKCGWGEGGSNDIVEIPFGAHDSELQHWEYTIPEGYTAEIKDGKVVVKKNESEDERIRKGLLRHFRNKTKPYWNEIAVKDILAWLEKQKIPEGSPTPDLTTMLVPNRYNEQKPAEWNEEDEKMLNELLDHCNTKNAEWYNWLKSLRPQPHWKPSDEQLQALWRAVEYLDESDNEDYDIIEGLYDDLTKLM